MEMHLLLLFPLLPLGSGSSDITGPEEVRGLEQGSLTVQCDYVTGWETYVKWWCQGAEWKKCRTLVETNGSEQEVKKDRVSIRDNQRNRTITVTMTELRQEDTDIYWCGIKKVGTDPGVKVRVTIDPATTTALTTTPAITTNMSTVPVTLESATGSLPVTDHDSDTSLTAGLENGEAAEESCWNITRAGVPALRERCLLCQPDPAEDWSLLWLLQGEAPLKVFLLCPGRPGSLSKGGHFLCSPDFGHLGSGLNLHEHGRPRHQPSQQEPGGAHAIQHHQEALACAKDPCPTPPEAYHLVPASQSSRHPQL